MYKLCKTEESSRRQKEIEAGLLSAMLTDGYEEITVSALCERLDMPRKAFYRYFDSKDDCLTALIDHTLLEYYEYSGAITDNKGSRSLRRELEMFFRFWLERRDFLDALEKSKMMGRLVDVAMSVIETDMVNTRKFLPDESELFRLQVFQFAICGLMFSMLSWYRSGFVESVHNMAAGSARMLTVPLFPNLDKLGFADENLQ